MQSAEIQALRDDMRSEIRRVREETNRELGRLEARLDRMDDRRFANWQALIKAEAILVWLLAVGLFVMAGTQA